ncbi:NUDIX hydrolase [Phaeobacter sp.]|uniref:NUDIX hydrolase n=1 Tax=Phaeobacter sp. TaxID=1902409 RepID=UPI0025DE414B|nr:NUDIX hydrolase [Phaeobacter sp.]
MTSTTKSTMISGLRSAEYACALLLQGDKILLGRRASLRATYPNCWDLIGGKIEAGETPEQALHRELAEEVAIAPLGSTYVETIRDTHIDPQTPPLYHIYAVRAWSGIGAATDTSSAHTQPPPVINNHEHSALEWFTVAQACDLPDLAIPDYRPLFRRMIPEPTSS